MKYDDAEYQFLSFTNDRTPMEWGGRVIALYFAWALRRGLGSPDMADAAAALGVGASPVEVLFEHGDGSLLSEFLSDEGNGFTSAYYARDYYADYEAVFDGEYADTGHAPDDALSIPDTPENLGRMSAVLDARFAQWKAGRLAPTEDDILEVVEATLTPLLGERGMTPATERDWAQASDLRSQKHLRYWGGDFPGGREWLFASIVHTDEGLGVHVNMSSCIDALAIQAWATDLRPHLNPRFAQPGDPLPLTAQVRMGAWWPHKLLKSKEGPLGLPVAGRGELAHLRKRLGAALAERGFPLLDRTRSMAGLGQLQRLDDPAKALLLTSPLSLVPLLAAEHAGRSDLMALCDAFEARVRKASVAPHLLAAALLFVDIIRKRNTVSATDEDSPE